MIDQQPTVNSPVAKKFARFASRLCIVFIITGILTLCFGISVYLTLRTSRFPFYIPGASIFISLWMIFTASLGIHVFSGTSSNRPLIRHFNASAMAADILAFVGVVASIAGFIMYLDCRRVTRRFSPDNHYTYTLWSANFCTKSRDYGVAVYAMLFLLHFLQCIISMATTVYGFKISRIENIGQQRNGEIIQAEPHPTLLQTYASQDQFQIPKLQQNEILVTANTGQPFILIPVTSTSQQLPIHLPIDLLAGSPPPYSAY
ncbi:uncharacterized protein LOC130630710 [Hydractinia symbiolongicarpus]|uniref:uncharacterized protein LOC130630710 n=1 Tax=Hydractinia symbiolongicarpus TaxID=13093 RepID=UPI00254DA213|nr:uncharacterized protein LOC130630710 [Hydractinia symbiolongicarpus]